jgi:hypothetical protein
MFATALNELASRHQIPYVLPDDRLMVSEWLQDEQFAALR